MKKFGGNPLFLGGPPPSPFQLTPLFLSKFFHDPPLCPNFNNKKLPHLIFGGGDLRKFEQNPWNA